LIESRELEIHINFIFYLVIQIVDHRQGPLELTRLLASPAVKHLNFQLDYISHSLQVLAAIDGTILENKVVYIAHSDGLKKLLPILSRRIRLTYVIGEHFKNAAALKELTNRSDVGVIARLFATRHEALVQATELINDDPREGQARSE
jgi:hypothetical protein